MKLTSLTTTIIIFVVFACVCGKQNNNKKNELSTVNLSIGSRVERWLKPEFLSIGLDTQFIRDGFCGFNWTLVSMPAEILHQRWIRQSVAYVIWRAKSDVIYGGKQFAYRATRNITRMIEFVVGKRDFMINKEWDKFYGFIRSVSGLKLVFDFNVLLRQKTTKGQTDRWNWRNAQKLMEYSSNRNYIMGFELGNEPDAFRHAYGHAVSPEQLAADYRQLQKLMKRYPLYARPSTILLGPSITRPRKKYVRGFLDRFLAAGGKNVVNAVSFHQYYLNGRTATLSQFLDPTVLDSIIPLINAGVKIAKVKHGMKTVWLGETASAYGGGAPNLSNTYADGFNWLDKLGLSAKLGIDVVIRQALFRGHYALLNNRTMPNPDYWLSLVYKHVFGGGVLNVNVSSERGGDFNSDDENSGLFRFYAHYVNKTTTTVYGMNLAVSPIRIQFKTQRRRTIVRVSEYLFEPDDPNNLQDTRLKINGQLMNYSGDGAPTIPLPHVRQAAINQSRNINRTTTVILPGRRYAIYLLTFDA